MSNDVKLFEGNRIRGRDMLSRTEIKISQRRENV